MQLTEWQAEFEALGVRIAAMSYDGVEVLADFAAGNEIGYMLLSDKGAKHFDALGIRNENYAEGHMAYGVPHPGVLFVDADGVIRLKRAVPGYRDRPELDELRTAVAALLAQDDAGATETADG